MKRRSRGARRRLEKDLERIAGKSLRFLGVRAEPPLVYFLPDKEMRRLKWRFLRRRAKPGRADVLSFPEPPRFPHPESRRRVLGEIYLNRDLKDKSRVRYAALLIHGLLHLLGYTHRGKSDIVKMIQREQWLIKRIQRD